MSTVKISELSQINYLNSNTANTLLVGVDLPSTITGKITVTTLAQGLYANNVLNVGNNSVVLPNTIAQFSLSSNNYTQVNLQNPDNDGTSDYVVTANTGTDTTYYVDLGFANPNYNNSNPNNSLGTALHPLDGYLYAQGNTGHVGGNLVIGTTTTGTRINFISGGINSENIVAYIDSTGIESPTINSKISANLQTAKAYTDTANSFNTNLTNTANTNLRLYINNNITANLTTAEAYTDTANSFLQAADTVIRANTAAAFNKANNALANTSGTFAGDLSITGNLSLLNGSLTSAGNMTVNGTMLLANSNFSPTESALTITATSTVVPPANDGYMIHISGKNGTPSRIVTDSYGTGAYSAYVSRTARGTVTSPSAVQTGDVLGRISSNGYGTTKFQQFGTGRIDFVATENYTDSKTGSQIQFWNCPVGSNTLTNIATFNGTDAIFTGEVNPQKGLLLTPNVVSGITNTLNIDIANNSLYKVVINNTASVNLSGYKAGKIVEVWMQNSSGSNQVVTHGCLSNNSTTNATTFTLKATSAAYLKYFSIDGDNANTFVSVVYS